MNKNFTMISNEIIKDLSANDIAVYCKMKYFSGMSGQCYASKKRIRTELHLGEKALNKAIKSLRNFQLISKAGTKQTMTPGGPQEIDIYNIKDVLKGAKGCPESSTSNTNTKKERKVSAFETPFIKKEVIISEEDRKKELEIEEKKLKKLEEMRIYLKEKFQIKKVENLIA